MNRSVELGSGGHWDQMTNRCEVNIETISRSVSVGGAAGVVLGVGSVGADPGG